MCIGLNWSHLCSVDRLYVYVMWWHTGDCYEYVEDEEENYIEYRLPESGGESVRGSVEGREAGEKRGREGGRKRERGRERWREKE